MYHNALCSETSLTELEPRSEAVRSGGRRWRRPQRSLARRSRSLMCCRSISRRPRNARRALAETRSVTITFERADVGRNSERERAYSAL